MDLSVTAGHLGAGVRTVEIAEAAGLAASLRALARRLGFRLDQALLTLGLAFMESLSLFTLVIIFLKVQY